MTDDSDQVEAAPLQSARRVLSGVELKKLAAGHGFSVDDTTGDRMIRALQDIVDALEDRWAVLEKLGSTPPLSTTTTARWISQRTVSTAADDYGLLTQLRQAREELPQYIEAIRTAKRNYAETETAHRKTIDGLSPS